MVQIKIVTKSSVFAISCVYYCLCRLSCDAISSSLLLSKQTNVPVSSAAAFSTSPGVGNGGVFEKNNPIVQRANRAVAEALAYQTINGNHNKKKPSDPQLSSKYCHHRTNECFVKNLATLPYGKLKYLTSMLNQNFSNAMNKDSNGMRFKMSNTIKQQESSLSQQKNQKSASGTKFNVIKKIMSAPYELLQGLMGKFAMGDFNAIPEELKRSDVASHGNAFEPSLTGGDPSTFTDRLAQPGLEGYHPYMGYEDETPGCAQLLSSYFECNALKHTPLTRQMLTDPRSGFINFRAKQEDLIHDNSATFGSQSNQKKGDYGLLQSLNYASRLLHKN
jgi:hypothetical protein